VKRNPSSPPPDQLPPLPPSADSSAAAEPPPGALGALANEAARVDAAVEEAMDPNWVGGGDGKAREPSPEKQDVPTADFLEGMLAPVAELVLPSLHHGFVVRPLKPHEVKMLAVTWGACLDHYFPGGVRSWGPVGGAVAASFAVFAPRLMLPASPPKPEPAPSA
jgi:hypothetical protein